MTHRRKQAFDEQGKVADFQTNKLMKCIHLMH